MVLLQSAALGLAIAGALALGYSNIFVTAPSPENLRTLFEFVFKGLDNLDYKEHIDYDLVESTNPAFQKAIVRVNVFRSHRQVGTIQAADHCCQRKKVGRWVASTPIQGWFDRHALASGGAVKQLTACLESESGAGGQRRNGAAGSTPVLFI